MFCNKCGSQNPDNNAFCEKCGSALRSVDTAGETTVLSPAELEIPPQAESPAEEAVYRQPTYQQPPMQQPIYPQQAPMQQQAYPQQTPMQQQAYPQQAPIQQQAYPQQAYQQVYQQQGAYRQQAPYQQPLKQEAPKKEKEGKKRTAPPPATTGIKVATTILCIFFCLFFVLTSLLGLVRNTLQEDTLSDILEDIDLNDIDDVEELLAELGIEDVIFSDDDKSHTVADLIYDNLTPETQRTLSKRTIRNALDDSKVRSFLIDCILGYTQYYTDDEKMETVDAEDIADFVDKNIKRLSDGEITYLTGNERSDLIQCLNETIDFEMLSRDNVQEMVPLDSSLMSFLLSPLLFWLLVVITVLIFAGLVVLNLHNLCACVPKVGVSLIVVGGLGLLVAIGCFCVTLFVDGVLISLLSPVFTYVATYFALPGGIAMALGLLAVIGGKALKKKEKAAAAAQ